MNKKAMSAGTLVSIIVGVAVAVIIFALGMRVLGGTEKLGEGFSESHSTQEKLSTERDIFDYEACAEGECANFNADVSGILRRQPYSEIDTQHSIGAILQKDGSKYVIMLEDAKRVEMETKLCIMNEDKNNKQPLTELYHDGTQFVANTNPVKLKNDATGDIFEPEGDELCLTISTTA
jgi:hypothetical protein